MKKYDFVGKLLNIYLGFSTCNGEAQHPKKFLPFIAPLVGFFSSKLLFFAT
jgi:hypothetical protein